MQGPSVREWASINGRLVPAEQAHVSVFDSGFMQGIGLFETMRAYNTRVFRLDRHIERLRNSARTLGWTVIPEAAELRENVLRVVGATELADARVRLTVTTGSLRADAGQPQLTIVATAAPDAKYPLEHYRKGATVAVSDYRQNPDDPTTGHKTTSYFARLTALRLAHARGAAEGLHFTHDGRLAEGAISNVFLVRGRELITPPLDTPVLPGITRACVIELAAKLRIPVQERPVGIQELLGSDEVFLTNAMMELLPVVRVEREAIGTERPGDVTRELYEAYGRLVEKECAEHG